MRSRARMLSRMRWMILLLVACGVEPIVTNESPDGKADGPGDPAAPIVEISGTHKVAQLTGDFDRERGVPTASPTASVGLWGTDLGASFEHAGKTVLLFGDSIPTDPGAPVPPCGDAIATTVDLDPSDGLVIDFIADDGLYRSPSVPGVSLGCYEVPLDGASVGGAMYVWFSTATMTRSVLARSDDDGRTFAFVHDLSASRFVNVSVVREGDLLYLFGSGAYRASDVYLARVAVDAIEDRAAYEFFDGESWTSVEDEAAALFGPACVGELSAHRLAALDAWIVLYNCGEPRGIQARVARTPTGAWSDQASVFEPWRDGGYCHFMHASWDAQECDAVHDAGREREWGGEYGPYVIEALTESLGEHHAALHFTLSTWNPYNTMLMRTEVAWR